MNDEYTIAEGILTEIDGVPRDEFDLIDHFIARRAINIETAERALNTPSVESALTEPNDYCGPGAGYRVEGERWSALQNLHQAREPRNYLEKVLAQDESPWFEEIGPAQIGKRPEVIIALRPTLGAQIRQSLAGLNLREVLRSIVELK